MDGEGTVQKTRNMQVDQNIKTRNNSKGRIHHRKNATKANTEQ